MTDNRLYFIIGEKNKRYIYKYILSDTKANAKASFLEIHSEYEIYEIRIISPSKRLLKQYSEILQRIKKKR